MHFNTSAVIAILRSDAPSLEAFQACLDEASTPHFSELSETENQAIHEAFGISTPTRPIMLFFTLLFSSITQNIKSNIPGNLLIATLEKLHALGEPNILFHLTNAIHLTQSLHTTPSVKLPGMESPKLVNLTIADLQSNLFNLMKTMRLSAAQTPDVNTFDSMHSDTRFVFQHFLIRRAFNWKNDDSALAALLSNDEGFITPLGFFHGLYHSANNIDITLLALQKGFRHPVPHLHGTPNNIKVIYRELIITAFVNPELTHQHLATLASALAPYKTPLDGEFNQTLFTTIIKTSADVTLEKFNVLIESLGWNLNENYRYSDFDKHQAPSFIKMLVDNLQGLSTLSRLLTLPHVEVNHDLAIRLMTTLNENIMRDRDKTAGGKTIVDSLNHLMQNPGLNTLERKDERTGIVAQIAGLLSQHIKRVIRKNSENTLDVMQGINAALFYLRPDDESLQLIIDLINAQENISQAQPLFNHFIDHPNLTPSQRQELTARTKNKREKNEKELLVWPVPITCELLEQEPIRAMQTALKNEWHQLHQMTTSNAAGFNLDSHFPFLPQTKHAYDQLPLALLDKTKPQQYTAVLSLNDRVIPLPLSLLLFRNKHFQPTQHIFNRNNATNSFLQNLVFFTLLGHTDTIFNLPEDPDRCLDSYVASIIRLTIRTTLSSRTTPIYAHHVDACASSISTGLNYNYSKKALETLLPFTAVKHNPATSYISDHTATHALHTTFKKYLESIPGIKSMLRQNMLLGKVCAMWDVLSRDKAVLDELKTIAITTETLNTLKQRLGSTEARDHRSAMLVIAFDDVQLSADEINTIFEDHLLNKTLNKEEKSDFIETLKLLDQHTLTKLKTNINDWLTENIDRCHRAQQLIDNGSSETNPLLLTLMLGKNSYQVKDFKQTTHYSILQSRLKTNATPSREGSMRELPTIASSKQNVEGALSPDEIREKSRAFIQANINGEITWSNKAPFQPLTLDEEKYLPLTAFSLEGIPSTVLWDEILSTPNLPRQFILFLFRHQSMPICEKDTRNITFHDFLPYIIAFTLLGVNEAVFSLAADDEHHLLSYEDALIKHAIHSELQYREVFRSKRYRYFTKAVPLKVAAEAMFITEHTFSDVMNDDVFELYTSYAKKSEPIRVALRQNQLLDQKSLLLGVDGLEHKQLDLMANELRPLAATEDTLTALRAKITHDTGMGYINYVRYLVLYIALSPETTLLDKKIKVYFCRLFPRNEKTTSKANIMISLKKLSPEHIAHLKYQLNAYCVRHKNDPIDKNNVQSAFDKKEHMLLFWLLQIGQTSLKKKTGGNYYNCLTLFLQNKPVKPEDAVKYGLTAAKPQ
jgi:hypothetical protein